MKVSSLQQVASPPDQIEAEAVAVLFFQDDRPLSGAAGLLDWRLNGALTTLVQQGRVSGAVGDQLWIQANGKLRTPWVLLVGGGLRATLNQVTEFRTLVARLMTVAIRSGVARLAIGLDPVEGLAPADRAGVVKEVWEDLGPADAECLITFDQSWIKRPREGRV